MTAGKERGWDMFKLKEKMLKSWWQGGQPRGACGWEGGRVSCGAAACHTIHSGGICAILGTGALPAPQRLPQHLRGWAEAFSNESQCVCLELDPDGET